ncbi:transglycosylase domain-containing protein [Salinicoccus hispanicus]|uniref:Penicillin-binding protein n=1 Tax=Salinicoccus hispanicus TaxID=157225 RepID=A0A6N8TZ27_9STAP|nr:transglycosylase domain-containing protein [Salinicoccus hispanicus]MXQ50297.1 penicillin-binding protein [Salinicoccus hispanicus]
MDQNYKRSGKKPPQKNGAQRKKKGAGRSRASLIKRIVLWMVLVGLVMLVAGSFLFAYYASRAPAFSEEKLQDPIPAKIYDKNDELVTTLYEGQERQLVDIEDTPAHVTDAVLSVEDNRFYDHGAIDFVRLGAAVLNNVTDGFGSQGASTITQQVVKRVFLTADKSLERKAQEAYLAYRLEQEYSKDEILEMYLNKIYYSDGIYGIRTAADYYFDKDLGDLNLAETAYLAGLPQLPNRYNLYVDQELGTDRANTVLSLMLHHGRITEAEYNEAVNTDLTANLIARSEEDRASSEPENPEYAAYINVVKQELQTNDMFRNMELGEALASGISIYTNMDSGVQRQLQTMVNNRDYYYNPKFQSDNFNMASTILDTETGDLVAISGGRDYREVVMHNQALVERNVGSTMKPFLAYGPAIENMQWRTDHTIEDEYEYQPQGFENTIYNYDSQDHGTVTMRNALRQSLNIPAVKTFETVRDEAGEDAPEEFAENVGLDYSEKAEGDYTLSFNDVLGGYESRFTPLQMAEAYATLGNGGTYNTAQSIRHVVTDEGETVEFENESEKAMEDYTAYMLTDMLKGTFEPYGSADFIQMNGLNIAAKTGTTSYSREDREAMNLPDNSAKDAWIVGYTPEYTMSLWTGFMENRDNGDSSFVGADEHITPQWFFRDIMQSISTYNGQDFDRPDSVVQMDGNVLAVRGSEEVQADDSTSTEESRNAQPAQTVETTEEPSQVIIEPEETTEEVTEQQTEEATEEETTEQSTVETTTEEPSTEEATEEVTEQQTEEATAEGGMEEETTEEAEPVEEPTEEETDEAS